MTASGGWRLWLRVTEYREAKKMTSGENQGSYFTGKFCGIIIAGAMLTSLGFSGLTWGESSRSHFTTFQEEEFGIAIAYPQNLLAGQKAFYHPNGRLFERKFVSQDKKVVLTVSSSFYGGYGMGLSNRDKIAEQFDQALKGFCEGKKKPARVLTQQTRGDASFVVSGYDNCKVPGNRIVFFEKGCLQGEEGDPFKKFTLIYPKEQEEVWGPIVKRIAESFN
jgi:hypothetical protein